jgi:hypothetical protein
VRSPLPGNDGPDLGDRLDPAELGVHVTREVGRDPRGAEVRPPSKSHSTAMIVPLPGGTAAVTVSITGSPTFTSARAPPFAVANATGWMPPRSAALDGSRTCPSA